MTLDSSEFLGWAGTREKAHFSTDIAMHDWNTEGPHILKAFHGTTHKFDTFSLVRSNHEAQFGNVLYFTSCDHDASMNYASFDGPDLKLRIENRAERLMNEIEADPGCADLPEDPPQELIAKTAQDLAEREIIGSRNIVLPLYLRLNKPFVIDASGKSDRPMFPDLPGYCDAVEDVADDHGISSEDIYERSDEFDDEIYEKLDAGEAELYDSIAMSLIRVADDLSSDLPAMPEFETALHEVSCNEFEKLFRENSKNLDIGNEDGDLVVGSAFAGVLRHLGFDSIVLLNADTRFSNMCMESETTHIHLMGNCATQIKSIDNCGNYDPMDANIFA